MTALESYILKFSRKRHKHMVKAHYDNFCAYNPLWLVLLSSMVPFVAIPSLWLALVLADCWGRKHLLLAGSALGVIGCLMTSWFPSGTIEFIGFAITGCGAGFLYQVIPTVCHEMNVGDYLFNLTLTWGSALAELVHYAASSDWRYQWRWSFAACGVLAFTVLPIAFLLSETPHFLIKKRRMEAANEPIQNDRGSGYRMIHSPVVWINVSSQIFQRVLGVDSIIRFGPLILESIGSSSDDAFLATFITGLVRAVGVVFTRLSYNRVGRRRTLIISCVGMIVSQVCLSILLHGLHSQYDPKPWVARATIAPAFILISSYSMFSGPCDWTEASYPEELRVLGASMQSTMLLFMTVFMNVTTVILICKLKSWVFALGAALVFGIACLIYLFLPEIGKKEGELPEAEIWKKHWFWKRTLPKDDDANGAA